MTALIHIVIGLVALISLGWLAFMISFFVGTLTFIITGWEIPENPFIRALIGVQVLMIAAFILAASNELGKWFLN